MVQAQRPAALNAAFEMWGRTDPKSELALANTLPGGAFSSTREKEKLERLVHPPEKLSADQALERLRAGTLSDTFAARSALTTFAERDPAAAAELALRFAPDPAAHTGPVDLLRDVLRVWMKSDLAAAKAWVETIPDPAARQGVRYELVARLISEKGIDTALGYIGNFPEPGERNEITARAASLLAQNGKPEQAIDLAQKLDFKNPRQWHLIERVLEVWLEKDPEQASAFLLRSMPSVDSLSESDRFHLNRALSGHLRKWTQRDPRSVAEFTLQLPEFAREEVLMHAIFRWAENDAAAAAQWVAELPAGNDQNRAARNLARGWARQESTAAAKWVDRLPPGPARTEAISGLLATILSPIRMTRLSGYAPCPIALLARICSAATGATGRRAIQPKRRRGSATRAN